MFDITSYDSFFKNPTIIENYESFIWTNRYYAAGDFELYAPINLELLANLYEDCHLTLAGTNRVMLVDFINITSSRERGPYITIKGHSLEWLLNRRIIWKQTQISGSLEAGVHKLILENAGALAGTNRTMNIQVAPSNDPRIQALKWEQQYTGDNLYTVVSDICQANDIGFYLVRGSAPNTFVFGLYMGLDRGTNQTENDFVEFSYGFENLLSSNYQIDTSHMSNLALVAGEGEGADRVTKVVGTDTGLVRREIFVDARDLSSTIDDVVLTPAEYSELLEYRGLLKLVEAKSSEIFDGSIFPDGLYQVNRDYNLGDVVQITNEFGFTGNSRITEIIFNKTVSGEHIVPTFVSI